MTLRILHVTNAFPYAEVPEYGIFVKEQVESLERLGVDCQTVFINGRADGKRAYLKALAKVRNLTGEYDVIHAHHLYSGLISAAAGTRKPLVISFQNDWLREVEIDRPLIQSAACRLGVRIADRVIFKSPIPDHLWDNPHCVHLPNGVNTIQFDIGSQSEARERLGLDLSATYLLFVSSKSIDRPQKRYDRYVETLQRMRTLRPDLDIRELLLVNKTRDLAIDHFNASNLHLLTSDFEGSPNSVKESLSSGVPVVATDVGNVTQMLLDVPHSFAATTSSAAELAALAIRSIESHPDRKNVRTSFLRHGLDRDSVASTLIDLYNSMIEGQPGD